MRLSVVYLERKNMLSREHALASPSCVAHPTSLRTEIPPRLIYVSSRRSQVTAARCSFSIVSPADRYASWRFYVEDTVSKVTVGRASLWPRKRRWAIFANILVRRKSKLGGVAAFATCCRFVVPAKRL